MQESLKFTSADIIENDILRRMPQILDILLLDRTTSTAKTPQNIIWANDNYKEYGEVSYAPTAQILPKLITGERGHLIQPRALKSAEMKKQRTKTKAEVFTPISIVKLQNDTVDEAYQNDDLEMYVHRKWLEITCGEAPYMASRYDMETGALIPIAERTGFVDRKLARINRETTNKMEWQRLAECAYKASYGFDWNGDSLLLARENLLYTYLDFYVEKWSEYPEIETLEKIAEIISYNVFQMDGLTYTVPLSEKKERLKPEVQFLLFEPVVTQESSWQVIPGKRVKIMNWDTNKMEYFDKGIK